MLRAVADLILDYAGQAQAIGEASAPPLSGDGE
jgi:hypothetical protein